MRKRPGVRHVHIADCDPEFCFALGTTMQMEGYSVAASVTVEQFLNTAQLRQADIAVINFQIGDVPGLTLMRRIKALNASTPVIMVSDQPDIQATVTAMKHGAHHVYCKPFDLTNIVASANNALRNADPVSGVERRGFSELTDREREVLQLISSGQTSKEAAISLGISNRTVDIHRTRVMQKLGARNAATLMRIVMSPEEIT